MVEMSTPEGSGRRGRLPVIVMGSLLAHALLAAGGGAALFAQGLQAGVGDGAWVLRVRGERALLGSRDLIVGLQAGFGVEYDSLAGQGDTWMVAGSRSTASGRSELFVVAGDRSQQQELPPPARASALSRRNTAVLLTAQPASGVGLSLDGIAWLEGSTPRDHSVWFAAWGASGFAAPQQISPPAAGSQVALRGTRLEDGTALLVWSGFDGEDDEIWWTRRSEGEWTPPARVAADNRVPDITPTLAAQGDGAQLAWSWYDGNHYRLLGSTFRDGSWSAPRPLAAPGSLYPELVASPQATYLVFLRALPRSWEVRQLAADLAIVAAASAASSRQHRPLLLGASPRGLELEWQAAQREPSSTRQGLSWGPIPTISPAGIP